MGVLDGTDILRDYQGEEWQSVRRMFNPGFSHQNLSTFLPTILDKAAILVSLLEELVSTKESFPLLNLTTNFALDVVGKVAIGADLHAQHLENTKQGELARLQIELLETFKGVSPESSPWWLVTPTVIRRRRLGRRINKILDNVIRASFKRKQHQNIAFSSDRSILATRLRNVHALTRSILDETRDQMKIILVGGHDTTGIMLSYAFRELSRHPRVLIALRTELDSLFGCETSNDPAAVAEKLRSPVREEIMGRMQYTNAVIKEALRLHPP